MRPLSKLNLVVLIAGAILTACGSQAQLTATVTATREPTKTPLPTSTPTPAPTDTPEPTHTPKPTFTPTPTVEPTLALGEIQSVEEGGFSFQPPLGYDVDIQGNQIGVFDKAGTIIISIIGVTSNQSDKSPEGLIDEFLSEIAERGDGEFKKEISYTVTIDNIEGLAFDLAGTLFGSSLRGQTMRLTSTRGGNKPLVFSLDRRGFQNRVGLGNRWKTSAKVH